MYRVLFKESFNMNYVGYYRVSTKKQEISGLGLDSQKSIVNKFVESRGGNMVNEYVEIETGTDKKYRPILAEAIIECQNTGSTLVVHKLDRLSRSVEFFYKLLNSKVEFVICDMPEASRLTLGIMVVMAEHEANMVSERTKRALRVLKDRGVKLGNPQDLTEARKKSIEVKKQRALNDPNNIRAYGMIRALKTPDKSWSSVAKELNQNNFRTSKGFEFRGSQAKRLYEMFASA